MKKKMGMAIISGVAVFATAFSMRYFINWQAPHLGGFYRQLILELVLGFGAYSVARFLFKLPAASMNISIRKPIFDKYSGYSFLLGALLSSCVLAFKIPAIPILKELNVPQFLLIMLAASISEEILCRGLVQGIAKEENQFIKIGRLFVSQGVICGTIVFSLIHISIYLTGGNPATCLLVMLFAFLMGIVAGKAKEKYNLGKAITTHVFFNIGGFTAGILINIGSMILTGHLISQ